MSRRRKKKMSRPIRLSPGPLPAKLTGRFDGELLVFSDASRKHRGGLAAVLFASAESEPLTATRTTVDTGSNELELRAALLGFELAGRHYPGQRIHLFSDNRDAVDRLNRACSLGLDQDQELADMLVALDIPAALSGASVHWIKAHSSCRGNALADQLASEAAA